MLKITTKTGMHARPYACYLQEIDDEGPFLYQGDPCMIVGRKVVPTAMYTQYERVQVYNFSSKKMLEVDARTEVVPIIGDLNLTIPQYSYPMVSNDG